MAKTTKVPAMDANPTTRRSLSDAFRPKPLPHPRLRCWTARVAEEVAVEIEAIARAQRLSINQILAVGLDRILSENGRSSVQELAPWYVEYLQRRGGTRRLEENELGANAPDFG